MLTTRKIGNVYYVRGTIRVGKESIKVKEHSTGFVKAKDAASYVSRLEADIREEILNPNADKSDKVLFDDCLRNYLDKKRLKIGELQKINIIAPFFEGKTISQIKNTWNDFCIAKKNLSIATINRYFDTLNAILKMGELDLNIKAPSIKKQPVKNKVIFFLTQEHREKLLSCYSKHAKPIFMILSLQGFREQELLQLLWSDIHLKDHTIVIRTSKNGETRSVPMHTKTWWILARKWFEQKCPVSGHVFLNNKGKPYTDTRKTGGGSPIRKAHITALSKLKKEYGITLKMRVHDWRHDWAARMVMAGNDLLTLQKLGGWKNIAMVERYTTFSREHEQNAINKI